MDAAGREVDGRARKLAEEYVDELRGALGARLRSALLFGSAARGEWIEGVSDVNVLVLVDQLDVPLLSDAAPLSRQVLARGVTPLLMEREEWQRAGDVFTLELADMQDAGVTLHGDDPVAGRTLQTVHMRLQAERELRAKLLHLHAGMMLAGDDPRRLGQLLLHALPSFVTYMRAALRIADRGVPPHTHEVIAEVCALAGADPAAFHEVHGARRAAADFESALAEGAVADRFNAAATRLAQYIDNPGR